MSPLNEEEQEASLLSFSAVRYGEETPPGEEVFIRLHHNIPYSGVEGPAN